jgi:ABC-type cobalamin/Fe3+-siderophores transport system ATPase subunit
MTPLIQFEGVNFSYGDRRVLANVSFTLDEGSCTALIGPNGAGKTTILRLISGSLKATSGSVLIEGNAPSEIPHRLRSQMVALVPQQLEVPFDFTVNQIVEQGRTPYLGLLRGPMPEDRIAVERALDWTDTLRLRNRIFNELSGGERQRVKIALGLAQGAKLLLLDEPTQNLDIGRQTELMELLRRLQREGITILASIHDLHLVPENFSAAHLLGPDHSLISGTPAEVLTPDHLSEAFHFSADRNSLLHRYLSVSEVI